MAPADSSFVGIDPGKTGALISAITSGVSGAQPVAERYLSQFSQLGLDTGSVRALLSDYGWVTGAEGTVMLRRRQGLAEHQPSGDFLHGMATAGAGKLNFATDAAAASAGKAEGQKLLRELDNGTSVSADMLALKGNDTDVSYMAALFTALGSDGLARLSKQATGKSASAKSIAATVGQSLATASYGMSLAKLVPDALGPWARIDGPGVGSLDPLIPFLPVGTFSSKWLSALAPFVLNENMAIGRITGKGVPQGANAIWEAIANNPQFAAEYFHQNTALIKQYVTGDNAGLNDVGFGHFLLAATIAPEGDTSPLYKQNAADFVKMFDSPPPSDAIAPAAALHMAMAMVAINYSADLESAVTAGTSTMGLTAADWGRFAQNAMEDPAAATLLGLYYSQDSALNNFFATYKPISQNQMTWEDWAELGAAALPFLVASLPEDAAGAVASGAADGVSWVTNGIRTLFGVGGKAADAIESADAASAIDEADEADEAYEADPAAEPGYSGLMDFDFDSAQSPEGRSVLQKIAQKVLTKDNLKTLPAKVGTTLVGSSIGTAFSSGTCLKINNASVKTACFIVVNGVSGAAAGFGSTLGQDTARSGAMISHGSSGAVLGFGAPLAINIVSKFTKGFTDWINREVPK